MTRVVELGQPDDRFAQLVRAVVARLREELLDVERMPLHPRSRLARAQTLLGQQLAVTHAADVADEQTDQRRHRARHRVAGALEQRLAGGQRSREVAPPPRVGELVARHLRTAGGELLDLADTDGVAARPGRDLVDLGRELVRVLADDLDEQANRVRVDVHAAFGELLRHPLGDAAFRNVVDEDVARLRARLPERRVLLELGGDEREHGVGSGAREVRRDRLDVGGLPALDVLDDDEPAAAAEQAQRVARRDGVVTAGLERGEELDAVLADPVAQPPERALDLRPVAAGDQVDGLELGRHRGRQA